jgi:hypothetical protein
VKKNWASIFAFLLKLCDCYVEMQRARADSAAWGALTQREREEKERFLRGQEGTATVGEGCTSFIQCDPRLPGLDSRWSISFASACNYFASA